MTPRQTPPETLDPTDVQVSGPDNGSGALPVHLEPLARTARDYARAATAENTRKAYAADWRDYTGWARRHGLPALPPDPQIVGLYIAACASGSSVGAEGMYSCSADFGTSLRASRRSRPPKAQLESVPSASTLRPSSRSRRRIRAELA